MKASLCPVCNGMGYVYDYDAPYGYYYTTGGTSKKTCHGCGGKGWVEVNG